SDWYRQENNLPPSFTAYLIKPIYSYKYLMYKRRRRHGVRYRLRHPGFYRVYPLVVQRRFISVPRLFYRHIGRHLKHLFLKYLGYREFVIKPILLKFFRSVVILAKSLFNYKVFMWYLFFVVI